MANKSIFKRIILLLVVVLGTASCQTFKSQKNLLPAEDIEVPVIYAAQIAVLKDPNLPPNSREKYEAAKVLAENVDFTFARNVAVLDTFFLRQDSQRKNIDSRTEAFILYYPFEEHYVAFRFKRTGNLLAQSIVEVE